MKPPFRHPSEALATAPDATAAAEAERSAPPAAEFRACCCPGRPLVRVIIPASPARPHHIDLLLCGHHYRVSQAAIAASHATAEPLPGRSADVTAALLRN